ncbi:MAG: hypothetical protein IPK16_23300 [Anaerolineales bacterium]|nr:hypothetical protein [Anaerolineales bacterium]
MPRAASQSERLANEVRHRAPPAPDIVGMRYRLQTTDLPEIPLRTRVRAVSGQGVENVAPLLHFIGVAKPLVLGAANIAAMIRITGSPAYDDWIGCEVQIYRGQEGEEPVVRIASALEPVTPARAYLPAEPQTAQRSIRRRWPALLLLLAVAIALIVVYLIDNWAQVAPLFPMNFGR